MSRTRRALILSVLSVATFGAGGVAHATSTRPAAVHAPADPWHLICFRNMDINVADIMTIPINGCIPNNGG